MAPSGFLLTVLASALACFASPYDGHGRAHKTSTLDRRTLLWETNTSLEGSWQQAPHSFRRRSIAVREHDFLGRPRLRRRMMTGNGRVEAGRGYSERGQTSTQQPRAGLSRIQERIQETREEPERPRQPLASGASLQKVGMTSAFGQKQVQAAVDSEAPAQVPPRQAESSRSRQQLQKAVEKKAPKKDPPAQAKTSRAKSREKQLADGEREEAPKEASTQQAGSSRPKGRRKTLSAAQLAEFERSRTRDPQTAEALHVKNVQPGAFALERVPSIQTHYTEGMGAPTHMDKTVLPKVEQMRLDTKNEPRGGLEKADKVHFEQKFHEAEKMDPDQKAAIERKAVQAERDRKAQVQKTLGASGSSTRKSSSNVAGRAKEQSHRRSRHDSQEPAKSQQLKDAPEPQGTSRKTQQQMGAPETQGTSRKSQQQKGTPEPQGTYRKARKSPEPSIYPATVYSAPAPRPKGGCLNCFRPFGGKNQVDQPGQLSQAPQRAARKKQPQMETHQE